MMAIKNRKCEYSAVRTLVDAGYHANGLIPLVEIVQENIEYGDLVNSRTGEIVLENRPVKSGANKGKDRWCKVKDPSAARDVTLEKIEKHFKDNRVFVDYFRCDMSAYKDADYGECSLVINLNNNIDAYLDKVRSVAKRPNLVPVITIKAGIDNLSPTQLAEFAKELKHLSLGRPIALRVDDIDGYEDEIQSILTSKDYLIYDINETPAVSKIEEFEELNNLSIDATKILLCSPRKRDIANGKFEEEYTVDNSHIVDYLRYGFDGVGDYAGLRDKLPSKGGPSGCALALLYDGWTNTFHAYVNNNSKLGSAGYQEVVTRILSDRAKLDRTPGECIVLETVSRNVVNGNYGVFATWISYTIERYVQQLHLAHGGYNF